MLYLKGFNGFCAAVPPFVPPDELGVRDSREERLTQMINFIRKLGYELCAISSFVGGGVGGSWRHKRGKLSCPRPSAYLMPIGMSFSS